MICLFPVSDCRPVSLAPATEMLDAGQTARLVERRGELESKLREWRSAVGKRRSSLLEPATEAWLECRAMPALRYTTAGLLRKRCGHGHHNLESAVDCLDQDEAHCVARGGHTDREILVLDGPQPRKLTPTEQAAVAEYRRHRAQR